MTPETAPDVQISLVNTNSRELLRQCLASLPAACGKLAWSVTLIDNASTDGSDELVKTEFPEVELIRNQARRGFSANHNEVVRRALDIGARYVLVLNEDTVLEPGSVAALVAFCDASERTGAAGPVIHGGDGQIQRSLFAFPTIVSEVSASFRPGHEREAGERSGWLNGSCVLVRSEALRQVGLLDERFFIFFEDTDLGLRLHQAGWRSAVCTEAQIVHLGHQVVSQPAYGDRMERQMIRSRYLYFRKHFGASRALLVDVLGRASFALRAAKAFAAATVRRDADERALARSLWGLANSDPRQPVIPENPTLA